MNGALQTYKRWEYDARGHTTLIGQNPAGVTTNLIYSYDSADRITTMQYYEAGQETVTTTYDAGGRPKTLCSSIAGQACYASGASYTALDQPDSWTLGNTLVQDWVYNSTTARLSQLKLGSGSPASIFDRSYSYDNADNVTGITDNKNAANSQTMTYDERERLTCWKLNSSSCSHTYSYDAIGNLMSRTNVGTYGYGAQSASCPAGALDKAHAAVTAGSTSYCYDRNGNMQTGGAWTYTWNADNTLASMTNGTAPESYTYDADDERVVRTAAGVTTVFFEGVWEQTTAGARKLYYTFNGQVVAMRDMSVTPNVVTYLHGDHLGSVSVATDSSGTGSSTQEYDPWGAVRAGGIGATSLNYTGQRLDATGLLYYHARYYNPVVARFVSADSVVPGNASGGMDGVALKGLTVDFHEPGFAAQIGGENGQPFWFQLSDDDKQKVGSPWGPRNPQALNRYSYVLNAPVRWTDPSGHCIGPVIVICAAVAAEVIMDVVVPAVVGAVVIAGAYVAGGEMGRSHAAAQNHKTGTALESRWQDRDSDVGPVRVRKLRNSEVSDDLHRSKKARGMGPKDSYYVDEEGNIYSGGDEGELTLEEPAESGDE